MISTFVLLSCDSSNLFERTITEDNSLWYIFNYEKNENRYINSKYCYKFHKNSKCDYLYYSKLSKSVVNFEINDVLYLKEWQYDKANAVFIIQGFKYKIISYSKDTIHLNFINNLNEITDKKLKLVNLKYDEEPSLHKIK